MVCRLAFAVLLVALGPGGAQAAAHGGFAVQRSSTQGASLGEATIRERRIGLQAWTREFAFERSAFRLAADYAYTHHEFSGLPTRNRHLHHLHLPMSWRAHDDGWQAELTPAVAASSNVFKDLAGRGGRDDVDLFGRVQRRAGFGGRLGWQVGLARDGAFGRPRLYPTASLLWRSPGLEAEIGLPSTRLDWKAGGDLVLGVALQPAGGRWHVVSDERGGAEFDYEARAWRGAVTAGWQPRRGLRLQAQAGALFARRFAFEDDTGAAIRRRAGSAAHFGLSAGLEF